VNLSIHPALIDQPIVVPVASGQTGQTSDLPRAQANKRLYDCDICEKPWFYELWISWSYQRF
jgi:hypothetical protein